MRVPSEEGRLSGSGVTLFIDRSLGREKVAAALRAAGAQVEPHDAHFPPNAPDPEWLQAVGARGWVVLSKDKNIRYRGAEKAAVAGAKVALFIFRGGSMRGDEIAHSIAYALPKILRLVRLKSRPFIATISKSGDVKLVESFT